MTYRRGGVGMGCAGVAVAVLGAFAGCGNDAAVSDQAGNDASFDAPPSPLLEAGLADDSGTVPVSARPPFDWVGIIGSGQSLSVGATAGPAVSTVPMFHNGKLLDMGPDPKYPFDGGAPSYAIVPLVEPIRVNVPGTGPGYTDGQYPSNIVGETPHTGMASEISFLFASRPTAAPTTDYVTIHSVVGWSGHALLDLDKAGGKRAYLAGLMEARVIVDLAKQAGKTFGYGAVVLTHGESDRANAGYGKRLETFIADYNGDLKAITGQTRDVVLLASQQSIDGLPSDSAVQLWTTGVENPGKIICTGPKYQYAYSADHLHFPAAGYRRLGMKYGEVFDQVVNQGKAWKPLQPKSATHAVNGNQVVVTFDVPNPPLAWDETLPLPHQTVNTAWANGRGFEVRTSANAAVTISSVAITAPDAVTITLSAAVTGPLTIGYATTQDGTGFNGGLAAGYIGQLCDSDEQVGFDEEAMTVTVTQGSPQVLLTGSSTFASRAIRDVMTGTGAPPHWTVLQLATPTTLVMSAPWTGASGPATLKIHHDLRNYAVHASLPAP